MRCAGAGSSSMCVLSTMPVTLHGPVPHCMPGIEQPASTRQHQQGCHHLARLEALPALRVCQQGCGQRGAVGSGVQPV